MSGKLADRLRQSREAAKLSQSELARRVGLSPQAVQHLEAGKSAGSRHLVKIAGVLGISPEWLSTGEDAPTYGGEKWFPLPLNENITGKRREEAGEWRILSIDAEDPNRLVFRRKSVQYTPGTLPVFIAESYRHAEMPSVVFDQEERQLRSWLSINEGVLTKEEMDALVQRDFMIIAQPNPDNFTPRPYYLNGQLEAYGLFVNDVCRLTSRIGQVETLHISPYKRPEPTDIVLVWHNSNAFVVGEFAKQTDDTIELEHPGLVKRLEPRFKDLTSFIDEEMPPTTLKLPLREVEAIHTAVGAEFVLPQSSRLSSTRAIFRSRFSAAEL